MRLLCFVVTLFLCAALPVQAQNSDLPASFRELLSQLANRTSPFPEAPLPEFDRLVFHQSPEVEEGGNDSAYSGNVIWQGAVRVDQTVRAQLPKGLHASFWHLRPVDRPGQRGSRVLSVTAMGGLVQVGWANEHPSQGEPAWNIHPISDVSGNLFPLKLGNRLSYTQEFKGQKQRPSLVVTERLESFPPTPWLAGPFWVIRFEGSGYNYPLIYSEKLRAVVQGGNANRLESDPLPQILRGAVIGGVAYGDPDSAITRRDYARSRPAGVSLARMPDGWRFEQLSSPSGAATAPSRPAQQASRPSATVAPSQSASPSQPPAGAVASRRPEHLGTFYPKDSLRARPGDESDECSGQIETCFYHTYLRHAVVDPALASRSAKMVAVLSRNRLNPASEETLHIGIGLHPSHAKSAQIMACNNLQTYGGGHRSACMRGNSFWQGPWGPANASASMQLMTCSNGGYFALFTAVVYAGGATALGFVCGASTIEAAKRDAENRCQAEAAAMGIPPGDPTSRGHGCRLAIAGLNDGIDRRAMAPRQNHANFLCFGRDRQRFEGLMTNEMHQSRPRVDAVCMDQILPVRR